jgi:hypothetical protein
MEDYAAQIFQALQEDVRDAEKLISEVQSSPQLSADIARLQESLADVRIMLAADDRGWTKWWGNGNPLQDEKTGLTLAELKDVSKEIRSYVIGHPLIQNAANLRSNYVWSKGVNIPGGVKTGKQGRQSPVFKFVNDPVNQDNLFSSEAEDKLEHAASTDGTILLLGDDGSKTVRVVPLHEFTDLYVNPDFPGEVWAYRRQWESYTGTTPVQMDRWYYTDRFPGTKQASITVGGKRVTVDKTVTLFDQRFNGQVGWPLGVPDLIAAVAWARMYSDAMKRGSQMQAAMATLAYKAVGSSAASANSMAVKIAGASGAGNTASMAVGNDLMPLSTAGKGYDFASLAPIAALIAAAAQVSKIDLMADPSAAGSSYGSAATLDPAKKRAIIVRQNAWRRFLQRIIKWGTGTDVDLFFNELEDPDAYRDAQQLTLAQASGLLHRDELRIKWLANIDSADLHNGELPPEPVLPPAGGSPNPNTAGVQAGGAGQGQANRTGGNSQSDKRTDTISKK